MKIKLLRNIGIEGVHTLAGTEVEVSRSLALQLIGSGRAEQADGKTEPTGGVISTESGLEPFPESEPEPEKPKKPRK
jgi:hypothetical protein